MKNIFVIRKNTYFDSVTLMSLSEEMKKTDGVVNVMVTMATGMNQELLKKEKLAGEELQDCTENDLVIAAKVEDSIEEEELIARIDEKLKGDKASGEKAEEVYATIKQAKAAEEAANMAVISVPGEHAAREARIALEQGMNVMLFSDNVSIEEERSLKELAHEKELLVMGPDCGTAVINGVGLCFANKVAEGNIGIVGASGTGMQEVMALLDRYGCGISNAIGVGGRDVKDAIGGIMMLDGIRMLETDAKTEVIVIVSKVPDSGVQQKLAEVIRQEITKPVVIYYTVAASRLQSLRAMSSGEGEASKVVYASSLLDAALKACELSVGAKPQADIQSQRRFVGFAPGQKYLRGLYCGGTLCAESFYYVKQRTEEVFSNVTREQAHLLADVFRSSKHTLLDLGDDFFTTGRAHPMIDPTIRLSRILEECEDPECAVILLDFEIGYGSNDDPVGATLDTIQEGMKLAASQGRCVKFVAYVLGTQGDAQNKRRQEQLLADCGCIVAQSNYEAVKMVCELLGLEE